MISKKILSIGLVLVLILSGIFNSQPCFAGSEILPGDPPSAWISGGGRITLKEAKGLKEAREKLKELQGKLKQLNVKIEKKKKEIKTKLKVKKYLQDEKRKYEREYDRLWEKLIKETFKAVIPIPGKGKLLAFVKIIGPLLGIRSWINITAQIDAAIAGKEFCRKELFRVKGELDTLWGELKDLKDQKIELDKKIVEVEKKIKKLEELGKTAKASLDGSESYDKDIKATWVDINGKKYDYVEVDIYDEIKKWEWKFGDEGSGSGEEVTHTYREAGNYTVKLTITDKLHGETASAYTIITVEDPAK